MTQTASTVAAADLAGVTVRQLNHWAAVGYVHAETVSGPGRGGQAKRWTPGEIDVAEMLGVFSRQLLRDDLLGLLAAAVRDGTTLTLEDGDFAVRIELMARVSDRPVARELLEGRPNGTNG